MSSSKAPRAALDLLNQQLRRMRDKDLTTVLGATIFVMVARQPGVTTSELAEALGSVRHNIYKAVHELAHGRADRPDNEGKGLVEMRPDPHDARSKQLHLTNRGVALLADLGMAFDQAVELEEARRDRKASR